MWRYQLEFYVEVKKTLKEVLEGIGFFGSAKIMLLGFCTTERMAANICFAPEVSSYSAGDFSGVLARCDALYAQHSAEPGADADQRLHEQSLRELKDESRIEAINEVLADSVTGGARSYFVSRSASVFDYVVHVAVGIDNDALAQVPKVDVATRDGHDVVSSLVDAAVLEFLDRARTALYFPDVGLDPSQLPDSSEIIRRATRNFFYSILLCAHFWYGHQSDALVSAISALTYEGRSAAGKLIIAHDEHPSIEVLLKLSRPVGITQTRAARKLMEASGAEGDPLTDGETIYGFGRVKADYDLSSETIFIISAIEHSIWELSHAGRKLLTVNRGVACLPRTALDMGQLEDFIERLLPGSSMENLLALCEAAAKHQDGAMVIISDDAASEATRLSAQALRTEPTPLFPPLMTQLTAVDGGILLDKEGRCHALGVILDGEACGLEDPARGSRYSNAIRYVNGDRPSAIVIVYSADGSVDILPWLTPRIERRVVTDAFMHYMNVSRVCTPENDGIVAEAWEGLTAIVSYLSEGQCRVLNLAHITYCKERGKEAHLLEPKIPPDPLLNDSAEPL